MIKILIVVYVLVCAALYFFQERLIFFPEKLDKDYKFSFLQPFEEMNIKSPSGQMINGLLFKADTSKGLVFYLHGNAGSLAGWGDIAKHYTALHYDFFILDYPGYGKSEGSIKGKLQLFEVIQSAYDTMKTRYREDKITVIGYSIGTGPAAYLASTNQPKLLILKAPYYSLADLVRHILPVAPSFLLKYNFRTNKYIESCKMPVVIFHGTKDEVIYYKSSLKLKAKMKSSDKLIPLYGQRHNGINDNPVYLSELEKILN